MAEKLEDLNLPNSVIARLIKEALPDGINVAKEARTALAKAASVFVLYVTSASTNAAKKNHRKTISGTDVLDAMEDIEFEQFIEPLKESLESYKKSLKVKKDATAKRKLETHKESDKEIEVDDDIETVDID